MQPDERGRSRFKLDGSNANAEPCAVNHGVLAILFLSMMAHVHAAGWEKLAPLPEPNGGFICGAIGDAIVIAGGTNWSDGVKQWLRPIQVFEPAKNEWRQVGLLPEAVAYAATGARADGVWFASGSSGTQTHATLGLIGHAFAIKPVASIDVRAVYCASALLDGRLFVIGGAQDQASLESSGNACFAIDLASGHAQRIADLPRPSFFTGAAAACAGRVFVFGGASWDSKSQAVTNRADASAYSPREDRWEKIRPLPAPNRGLAAVAIDDERIVIAGGYKNDVEEFTDETFVFDVKSGEYQRAKPLPYRALAGLVKCGEFLYCLGGEDRKQHRTDACFRIHIEELRR